MLRLLLFRRANKILELKKGNIRVIDIYKDEEDEFSSHISYGTEDRIGKINGFYYEGIHGDILIFYVENNDFFLRYKKTKCKLLNRNLKFKCYQINKNIWVFECLYSKNGFKFVYKSYTFDPYDDYDETEVNFGLFIISVLKNEDKQKHMLKVFSH